MKMVFPCTLILAVLGVSMVWAQDYRPMPSDLGPPQGIQLGPVNSPAVTNPDGTPPQQMVGPGLSQWITYKQPD